MSPLENLMVKAMAESRAKDDEGDFEPLSDLIGFSGENKTRTVLVTALRAALIAAGDQGLFLMREPR